MSSRFFTLTILLASAVLAASRSPASVAPGTGSASADALDQKKIHADYNDGNFERVTQALETFMATHKSYSFQDSVFIAKHLAVVYTANPDTREKGKYYMYRLLALLPSAKLVDMYVSDEIDRIFDKVREEFMARQRNFGVDTARIALPEKPAAKDRDQEMPSSANAVSAAPPRKENHVGFWIAGGTVAVAAGLTTAYFIFENQPAQPADRLYRVPKQ